MAEEPRFLKATALHVQGLRESKRIATDAENPEAAAFVGYMFGLELGMTLARADLEWVKTAHDELTTFNVAVDHDDRRIRRRRSLLTEANAIIRATQE
jgi:hypothetical protein